MANVTERQIMIDGWVNAVVKLTGQLDTNDISLNGAIKTSDFINNDPRQTLIGFRIMEVDYSIGSGIEMLLAWNQFQFTQQIFPLAGRGTIDSKDMGGWFPDQTKAGFDGSISLFSSGYMTGKQNYTVTLMMKKIYRF